MNIPIVYGVGCPRGEWRVEKIVVGFREFAVAVVVNVYWSNRGRGQGVGSLLSPEGLVTALTGEPGRPMPAGGLGPGGEAGEILYLQTGSRGEGWRKMRCSPLPGRPGWLEPTALPGRSSPGHPPVYGGRKRGKWVVGTLAKGIVARIRLETWRAKRRMVEIRVDAVKDSSAGGCVGLRSAQSSTARGRGRRGG